MLFLAEQIDNAGEAEESGYEYRNKYDAAVALLAVHCSISLNDAIQAAVTGARSKYDNHAQTLADLERLCTSNRIDPRGLPHLRWLLSNKTAISYGDRRFTQVDIAREKAERFQRWAYDTFKEVLRAEKNF